MLHYKGEKVLDVKGVNVNQGRAIVLLTPDSDGIQRIVECDVWALTPSSDLFDLFKAWIVTMQKPLTPSRPIAGAEVAP
jgi:hypothetical protein